MKVIGRVITAMLVVVVIGVALLYLLPGYNMLIVRSESMTPTLNLGDLIITSPPDGPLAGQLEEGRVITFELNDELVTHRIYTLDGQQLTTKGDAVEDPDPWPLTTEAIRGVYLFKIPCFGYVTGFIQTRLGWFLMIVVPGALLVLWLVKDIVKEALSNA